MARKLKTMDGNTAAATVSYAFTDVAAIYPITPSSVMAELTDEWSAARSGRTCSARPLRSLKCSPRPAPPAPFTVRSAAGALTTTYTASQGLLLMIPNMYKIAGELLPGVIHVSARALAIPRPEHLRRPLRRVWPAVRPATPCSCSTNVQEVMDLGAVAHLSTIKGRVPVLHFFDGFRTSHEIQQASQVWDYEDLAEMVDWDAVAKLPRAAP